MPSKCEGPLHMDECTSTCSTVVRATRGKGVGKSLMSGSRCMHSVQHMNDKLTSNADERICNIDESNQEVTGPDSKIDEASLDVEYTAQQNPVFIKSATTVNHVLRAPQRVLAPARERDQHSQESLPCLWRLRSRLRCTSSPILARVRLSLTPAVAHKLTRVRCSQATIWGGDGAGKARELPARAR